MKKLMIATAVVAVLAAGAVFFSSSRGQSPRTDGTPRPAANVPQETKGIPPPATETAAARATHATNATAKVAKRKMRFVRARAADRTDLPPNERRLLTAIESAVDRESLSALQRLVDEAGASTNPEVRGDLVEALGWFGDRALLDLMPFMADPDADVAESAIDNWTTALADVDDEKDRSRYVVSAMKILTDKEALDAMIMQLDDCDDLIGMQALIDVIESPNKAAAEVAREHYEFTTGEKYVDFDTANEWITENYVSDDGDDD